MDHILIPMKEEEEESEQMISPSGIHSVIEGYVSMSIEYKETYMCLETNSLLLNSLNHLIFINYPKSKCLYAMQSFMHKTYYCCRSSFSLDTSHMKNHPKYTILASHIQLPLQDQQINVILIQKPISRKEIMDWTRQDALKGLSTSDKVEK